MLTLPHGDTEKRCLIARSYLKSTIVFSSAQDYALLQSMSLILAPLLVSWGCHNKFPQACRLKTTNIYLLAVLEAEIIKSRCWSGCIPSIGYQTDSGPFHSQLWVAPSVPWLVVASLQSLLLWSHYLSSSVCQISPVCLLVKTFAIRFRVHPDNPGWSHLEILSYICKDAFPNMITFTGSGDSEVGLFITVPPLNPL